MDPAVNTTNPKEQGALEPPRGVIADFDDPQSIQAVSIAAITLCFTFSTVFSLVRIYTRGWINKQRGWDDYFSCTAWFGEMGFAGLTLYSLRHGAGIHQWDVRMSSLNSFLYYANIQGVYYGALICLAKISICLQYIRLFVGSHKGKTYWLSIFLIAFNVLFYLICSFLLAFQCHPRMKIWIPGMSGNCFSVSRYVVTTGAICLASDIAQFLLPIFCVWKLQIARKQKVGISIVFTTGALACLWSLMHIIWSIRLANTRDITFVLCGVTLWAHAEIVTAIVCGCMPAVPAFYNHFRKKVNSRSDVADDEHRRMGTTRMTKMTTPQAAGSWLDLEDNSWCGSNYVELDVNSKHSRTSR